MAGEQRKRKLPMTPPLPVLHHRCSDGTSRSFDLRKSSSEAISRSNAANDLEIGIDM